MLIIFNYGKSNLKATKMKRLGFWWKWVKKLDDPIISALYHICKEWKETTIENIMEQSKNSNV